MTSQFLVSVSAVRGERRNRAATPKAPLTADTDTKPSISGEPGTLPAVVELPPPRDDQKCSTQVVPPHTLHQVCGTSNLENVRGVRSSPERLKSVAGLMRGGSHEMGSG